MVHIFCKASDQVQRYENPNNTNRRHHLFRPHLLLWKMMRLTCSLRGRLNLLCEYLLTVLPHALGVRADMLLRTLPQLIAAVRPLANAAHARIADLADLAELTGLRAALAALAALGKMYLTELFAPLVSYASRGAAMRFTKLPAWLALRDNSRCVVTHTVDHHARSSPAARAPTNLAVPTPAHSPRTLSAGDFAKVAPVHILPPMLTATNGAGQPAPGRRRRRIWELADRMHHGLSRRLPEEPAESPRNTMLMTEALRISFCTFEAWLEPTEVPNTYIFCANNFEVPSSLREVVFEDQSRTGFRLPDREFLSFHYACARILAGSGADKYIVRMQKRYTKSEVIADEEGLDALKVKLAELEAVQSNDEGTNADDDNGESDDP